MDEKLAKKLLSDFVKGAKGQALIDACEKLNLKPSDVPRWADRKALYPDQKLNPVKWIQMHYGNTKSDGSWDSLGLTRAQLRQSDPMLYQALNTHISRLKKGMGPFPKTYCLFSRQ